VYLWPSPCMYNLSFFSASGAVPSLPTRLVLSHPLGSKKELALHSPIAIAVLPLPMGPAIKIALPAILPSSTILRINPAALRAWP
jgi:hypothetical protein